MVLVRTRDYHAFVQLFNRYRPRAVSFAARMTGSADAAEEVAHEAFVAMTSRAASYKPKRAFRLWFFAILHEVISKRLSKVDTAPKAKLDALAAAKPEREGVFSSPQAERARPAFEALGAIKPAYREVACLRALEGMDYPEIAKVTGEKVKTVMGRMDYAIEHLRKGMAR